jgi:uncharacterized membrane protein (DUF2068 family)
MRLPAPIRLVAVFEAVKGALVILAGFGLLALFHRNLQSVAAQLVGELELNPAQHYPRIFIDAAAHFNDSHRWLLALFAAFYGTVRGVEAYGLWHGRRWAEWFAAVSGGIYIPVEIYELVTRGTLLSVAALVVNIAIVLLMLGALRRGRPDAK